MRDGEAYEVWDENPLCWFFWKPREGMTMGVQHWWECRSGLFPSDLSDQSNFLSAHNSYWRQNVVNYHYFSVAQSFLSQDIHWAYRHLISRIWSFRCFVSDFIYSITEKKYLSIEILQYLKVAEIKHWVIP